MCFLARNVSGKDRIHAKIYGIFNYEVGGIMEIVMYIISLGNYFQYILFLKVQWRAEDQEGSSHFKKKGQLLCCLKLQ